MRVYALITHERLVSLKSRAVLIDGSATLTIAMSSTTMNWTMHSKNSAMPLCSLVLGISNSPRRDFQYDTVVYHYS